MPAQEAVQEVLDLDRKLQEKKQSTISLLLEERRGIDTALKSLGYIEGAKAPKVTAQKPKNPCGVCKSTDHDGRFHRRKDAAPPTPPAKPAPPAKAPAPPPK